MLLLISSVLALYGGNWDSGHYLHPDERLYINASDIRLPVSIKEFLSPQSPLNLHMFYYGPLPVYLYKIFYQLFNPTGNLLLTGRFLSGLFTILTVFLIFQIGKRVFNEKVGLVAGFIFIFAPGIIQHAHFITTESILNFFLALIMLISIFVYKNRQLRWFLIIGLLIGAATASKVTGLSFGLIPLIVYIYLLVKAKNKITVSVYFFGSLILAGLTSLVLSPYQIIDFHSFMGEQLYMQSVVLGFSKAPFTLIYQNTPSYIYPLLSILPLTFGFLSLPLSLIGFYYLIKSRRNKILTILLIAYPLVYFAWAGAWFAKFSRYYILLIPFLSLFAAYAISRLQKKYQIIALVVIAANGLIFFKSIYFQKNTRVQASDWVYQHILPGKVIAGEYWDDNLPFPKQSLLPYTIVQLDVYAQPDDRSKLKTLADQLGKSDYFIISSRRVYASILRNENSYPLTVKLYQSLFSGKLGYKLVKKFTNYPFGFPDDWADESFQSYDHPPVMIFANEKRFTPAELISTIWQ